MRRTKRQKSQTIDCREFRDSCAQNTTSEISKHALSGIMGLLRAEQDVGILKTCTFRNYGTPVRRAKRRKSQRMHFQDFWDSRAQDRTSEISKHALSRILGLLCAEQNVRNLNTCTFSNSGTSVRKPKRRKYEQMYFQEFWDSCAQNKTSEISTNALSRILGLSFAEQNVEHLKM